MSNGLPAAVKNIHGRPPAQWRYSGGGYFGSDSSGTATSGILWRNRQTGGITRWLLSSFGTELSAVDMDWPSLNLDYR
jgi:hypothetical protein